MRLRVYFGVLLFAAITSARFHPAIKEVMIKSPFDEKYLNSKTMNGLPAVNGQFPFVVRIFMHILPCGGALISPSWVLTSGICLRVYQGAVATVYLGTIDDSRPALMITTDDTRLHPHFIQACSRNDIGLINLKHSVIISDTIAPITLPRESQTYPNFGSGRIATIAGWKRIEEDDPTSLLHFDEVLIISNDQCKAYNADLHFTELCAVSIGEPPQNSCHGTSGTLMFLRDLMDDVDILVGIIDISSCVSQRPSFSIRPQHYLDWIYNTTGLPIRP